MGPGGDLRHDAAIGRVLGDLTQNLVRKDRGVPVVVESDDRGRRFVAGGFYAENAHEGNGSGRSRKTPHFAGASRPL
jgi:hypothetical protein